MKNQTIEQPPVTTHDPLSHPPASEVAQPTAREELLNEEREPRAESTTAKAEAKQAAQEIAEYGKQRTKEAIDQATASLESKANECVEKSRSEMNVFKRAADAAAAEARNSESKVTAPLFERLSQYSDTAQQLLSEHDARQIFEKASGFVKANPGKTIGALALLGFVAGRFLNAQSEHSNTASEPEVAGHFNKEAA